MIANGLSTSFPHYKDLPFVWTTAGKLPSQVQTLTPNEFTNIARIARLFGPEHGFDVAFAVALTCLRKRDPYLWAASLELPQEIVDLFKHAFKGRLPD